MGNSFRARIFGRRKHGDREEVQIQLFNNDGSPADLGGGGGGVNETIFFDAAFSRYVPNDAPAPVPANENAPSRINNIRNDTIGVEATEGDSEFVLPAGFYIVWAAGQVATNDGSGETPVDGAWAIVDDNGNQILYYDNISSGNEVSGVDGIQPQPMVFDGGTLRVSLFNDYGIDTDGGIIGQVALKILKVG